MIRKNLEQSEYLIYFASPDAAASEWVQSELERWCSDGTRCERLIMVLTDGNIGVDVQRKRIDWERTDALPAALADKIQSIPL